MDAKLKAGELLEEYKGEGYTFGFDVLDKAGEFASGYGEKAQDNAP
ncbi:MAG TPA: hypothetical protein VKY40_02235 [Halanaerobiales bacterium]|nr:hypothetical protein [Halanaerobiales bacterium]